MSAAENVDLHSHHANLIAAALATGGGHLSIGRGGFILWYGDGCRLLGYDPEPIKAACIAAGLPVIDSRGVAFDAVARLVIRGPMIAVGAPPDPPPHGPFSYAPLAAVAAAYRTVGAEVVNLPEPAADAPGA